MSPCVYTDVSTHICLLLFHIPMQAGRQTPLPGAKPPHQVKDRDGSITHCSFPSPSPPSSPSAEQELLLLLAYEPY